MAAVIEIGDNLADVLGGVLLVAVIGLFMLAGDR
jgi:hypothetical protein